MMGSQKNWVGPLVIHEELQISISVRLQRMIMWIKGFFVNFCRWVCRIFCLVAQIVRAISILFWKCELGYKVDRRGLNFCRYACNGGWQ